MEACTQVEMTLVSRTHGVSDEKMKAFIEENLKVKGNLSHVYHKMMEISKEFVDRKDSKYRLDKYLALVAATLACKKKSSRTLRLPAGEGKSFVILLLAVYHARFQNKVVCIVVPNRLLYKQMKQDLDLYVADKGVLIQIVSLLKHEAKDADVFICDEFDYMLEKEAVTFCG